MDRQNNILSLFWALIASILVHVVVVFPFLIDSMSSKALAQLEKLSILTAAKPELPEDEIHLGIDAETPSSLTWIGYEEYQEQIAPKGPTEQANMALANAGGDPAVSNPLEILEQNPTRDGETQEVTASPPEIIATLNEEINAPEVIRLPEDILAETKMDKVIIETALFPDFLDFLGPAFDFINQPTVKEHETESEEADTATEAVKTDSESTEEVVMETRPVVPVTPSTPQQPGEESPTTGDPADKESDATSILEVKFDKLKVGKPIASQGLELFPRRPVFMPLTLLTAMPMNPLCSMEFDRNGIVERAKLLKSTGHEVVDTNMLSSLYAWRAKGKQLEGLKKDETIEVRIRIILIEGRDAK